jgi:hypothetical protein
MGLALLDENKVLEPAAKVRAIYNSLTALETRCIKLDEELATMSKTVSFTEDKSIEDPCYVSIDPTAQARAERIMNLGYRLSEACTSCRCTFMFSDSRSFDAWITMMYNIDGHRFQS